MLLKVLYNPKSESAIWVQESRIYIFAICTESDFVFSFGLEIAINMCVFTWIVQNNKELNFTQNTETTFLHSHD